VGPQSRSRESGCAEGTFHTDVLKVKRSEQVIFLIGRKLTSEPEPDCDIELSKGQFGRSRLISEYPRQGQLVVLRNVLATCASPE